jgi:hypothetical protein
VIGSLFRSVTHSLLSNGRYAEAVQLTQDAASYLQPGLAKATPGYLSLRHAVPGWLDDGGAQRGPGHHEDVLG